MGSVSGRVSSEFMYQMLICMFRNKTASSTRITRRAVWLIRAFNRDLQTADNTLCLVYLKFLPVLTYFLLWHVKTDSGYPLNFQFDLDFLSFFLNQPHVLTTHSSIHSSGFSSCPLDKQKALFHNLLVENASP